MRFSIYSEVQSWPGKPYDQLYGEVLEQIENADRLGYDAYAVDRAPLLPEVLGLGERRSRCSAWRRSAHAPDQLPDDAAHPPVPQPARPRGA